jgi:hypothetical protein
VQLFPVSVALVDPGFALNTEIEGQASKLPAGACGQFANSEFA